MNNGFCRLHDPFRTFLLLPSYSDKANPPAWITCHSAQRSDNKRHQHSIVSTLFPRNKCAMQTLHWAASSTYLLWYVRLEGCCCTPYHAIRFECTFVLECTFSRGSSELLHWGGWIPPVTSNCSCHWHSRGGGGGVPHPPSFVMTREEKGQFSIFSLRSRC